MSRSSIERKLTKVSSEISSLRDALRVLDEQLDHFVDGAEEANVRALVSENGADEIEHRQADRAVAGIRRDREARMKRIDKLEAKQDALLDKLNQVAS